MKKPHIPHICTIADPFVILLRTRSGRGVDHRPWPYPRASINHDSVTELCTDTTSYGHPHPHDRSSFKVIPGGGREASGVGRSPVFPPTDKGDVRCGRFLKFCKLEIWFFFWRSDGAECLVQVCVLSMGKKMEEIREYLAKLRPTICKSHVRY